MPRTVASRLIDTLPVTLLPIAAGTALASALAWAMGLDALGAARGLLAAMAVTFLLIAPALFLGAALGALAGAWAGLAPHTGSGLAGRALIAAGPLLPGFLLAAFAALAVRAGAAAAPLAWAALALPAACQAARLARPAMTEALTSDALRMAEGFGLDDRAVLRHHALPAALAPVLGGFANATLAALAGAVALESLLDLPGLGGLLIDAARTGSTSGALPALIALCGLAGLLTALGTALGAWLQPLAGSGGRGR